MRHLGPEHATHKVTIQSAEGTDIPIQQKNIFTPRKNLGHFKSPAGTYKAQYKVILDKAQGVVDGIISSGATSGKAQLFYGPVYCPTVK